MPARLFQGLGKRSQLSVKHAIESLETEGVSGVLALIINNGKVEAYWTSGPAEVVIDPWRKMKPAS